MLGITLAFNKNTTQMTETFYSFSFPFFVICEGLAPQIQIKLDFKQLIFSHVQHKPLGVIISQAQEWIHHTLREIPITWQSQACVLFVWWCVMYV